MSKKDNTNQDVPKAPKNTIQFGNGPEYIIDEMPDDAKILYKRWLDKKNALTMVEQNADDLRVLLSTYELRMKSILEPPKKMHTKEKTDVVS
tara:strand:- start:34 stop:309 length:276 start_codon:yes stop_codon:yes gene_type:complete